MKRYLPYLLTILAFFAGQLLGTQDKSGEELLKAKFEEERKKDWEAMSQILHENTLLKARMNTREKDYRKDSAARAEALARQESISAALIKENERINYKNYSNPDLDSIDAILFGAR